MSDVFPTTDQATRLAAIIGSPVDQSLSPIIHNAVFLANKVNWRYLAFLLEPSRVAEMISSMPKLGLYGLSVTMPHKNQVAEIVQLVGEVDQIVKVTQAANTVVLRSDNSVWATNTDGLGCCNAIESVTKSSLSGRKILLLGAGSTASAVAYELVRREVGEVVVANRTVERARDLALRIGGNIRVSELSDLPDEMSNAEVIINTTAVGFNQASDQAVTPVDLSLLKSTHIVLDAVYRPLNTALLNRTREVGGIAIDGIQMLVHQAAIQQLHWLGFQGDVDLMRMAALAAL